jgi:outer membrane cobalamin receptor
MEWFGSGAVQSRNIRGFQAALSSDLAYHYMRSNLPQYVYPTRVTSLTNLALNYSLPSVLFYGNILQVATFEQAESTDVAENHHKFSPTLGVNYQHRNSPHFSCRFFYKETYRIPTFNELYYTNMGNTNLLPELAKQWNVGITFENSSSEKNYFAISVDGYFNKVTDKIVAIPRHNLFTWTMGNIGRVDVYGLDAVLKGGLDVHNNLDFFTEINYTFQHARDVSDPTSASYDHQIPYTPRHSGSAVVGVNRFLTLQYGLIFSGERFILGVNSANNRLEPYFDHSISLSKTLSIRETNLRMAFEILNITNKNYQIIAFYPMPGRQYRFTVKARIAPMKNRDANGRVTRASTRNTNT